MALTAAVTRALCAYMTRGDAYGQGPVGGGSVVYTQKYTD